MIWASASATKDGTGAKACLDRTSARRTCRKGSFRLKAECERIIRKHYLAGADVIEAIRAGTKSA
ncbi:MAG: hypothetical protein Rhirs2KO_08600 [Rhizobiaceae bacterium]